MPFKLPYWLVKIEERKTDFVLNYMILNPIWALHEEGGQIGCLCLAWIERFFIFFFIEKVKASSDIIAMCDWLRSLKIVTQKFCARSWSGASSLSCYPSMKCIEMISREDLDIRTLASLTMAICLANLLNSLYPIFIEILTISLINARAANP